MGREEDRAAGDVDLAGGRMTTRMASLIFESADADHDGSLSIDEAANAAAKFVHDTDGKGKGKLDQEMLLNIIRERTGGGGGGPPASGNPPRRVEDVPRRPSRKQSPRSRRRPERGSCSYNHAPIRLPDRVSRNRSGQALGFLLRFGPHVAEVPFRICTPTARSEGDLWFWIAQA